ncbi:MAG: fumarylacetoacetate hydrolase family protein [Polaromonas sp.]|nr:fumarylacetoacetate hydrolase family protein [Polaromonas sp.]
MKLTRCRWNDQIFFASVDEAQQTASLLGSPLAAGADPVRDVVAGRLTADSDAAARQVPLADVQLLSPFARFDRNPFAVGKNYHEHALEFDKSGFNATSGASAIPAFPQIFSKATTSLVGPGDAIRFDPAYTASVDYEGEVGVVIGRQCRNVARADAMAVVFGFVLLNDVTARDLQKNHAQWFLGKSLDTFCPLGPWIATRDEIDVASLQLQTFINGELRQDAPLSQLIFDIPTLIETISRGTTLLPGDIIATGTPAGVGIGFTPPRFLKNGDVVRITAPGLGELVNPVQEQAA